MWSKKKAELSFAFVVTQDYILFDIVPHKLTQIPLKGLSEPKSKGAASTRRWSYDIPGMSHKNAEAFAGWLSLGLPGSLEKIVSDGWGEKLPAVQSGSFWGISQVPGYPCWWPETRTETNEREGGVQRDRILIQLKGSCDVWLSGVIPITLILEFGHEGVLKKKKTQSWSQILAHHSIAACTWVSYLSFLSIGFPNFLIHWIGY